MHFSNSNLFQLTNLRLCRLNQHWSCGLHRSNIYIGLSLLSLSSEIHLRFTSLGNLVKKSWYVGEYVRIDQGPATTGFRTYNSQKKKGIESHRTYEYYKVRPKTIYILWSYFSHSVTRLMAKFTVSVSYTKRTCMRLLSSNAHTLGKKPHFSLLLPCFI